MRDRLRHLHVGVRLGLTGVILTFLLGQVASGLYLKWHYQNRDERPGLTLDDIKAAYHGINAPAPLLSALERGHPDDAALAKAHREILVKWLKGTRISEDYDNLDLGAAAPGEIIAQSCVSCHSRKSSDVEGRKLPLENWEDVKKVAFSRQINPVPLQIVAVSTHTHALSLATLSTVVFALALLTRWPRALVGVMAGVCGVALFADIASWWLARLSADWVAMTAVAGAAYSGLTAMLLLLVLLDLWWPAKREKP